MDRSWTEKGEKLRASLYSHPPLHWSIWSTTKMPAVRRLVAKDRLPGIRAGRGGKFWIARTAIEKFAERIRWRFAPNSRANSQHFVFLSAAAQADIFCMPGIRPPLAILRPSTNFTDYPSYRELPPGPAQKKRKLTLHRRPFCLPVTFRKKLIAQRKPG